MTMATDEVTFVPSAQDMDDDTFKKHFQKRHSESLGGLSGFTERVPSVVLEAYRVFHDRIHRLAIPGQLDHEHRR